MIPYLVNIYEILFSLKKEKALVVYNNMDEAGGHCAYEISQTQKENAA